MIFQPSRQYPLIKLLVILATTFSLPVSAQSIHSPNRITSFHDDSQESSLSFTTSSQAALPPPRLQYLPAANGKILLVVDFYNLISPYSSYLIKTPSSNLVASTDPAIETINFGQFQTNPAIFRLAFKANNVEALKTISFSASSGELVISWHNSENQSAPLPSVAPAKEKPSENIATAPPPTPLKLVFSTAQLSAPPPSAPPIKRKEKRSNLSSPFTSMHVVLDPGHGGSDPGAQRGDIQEKELTLAIAYSLKRQLEKKGIKVTMTRTDDTFVSLADRVKLSNTINPDLFLSIHINSLNTDSDIHGIETYYQTSQSKDLAESIHTSLVSHLSVSDRYIRQARFYVINHTVVPSVLSEVGFISCPQEKERLISSDYQHQIASALKDGVILYLAKQNELAQSKQIAQE